MSMRRLNRRLKRFLCQRRMVLIVVTLLGLFGLSYHAIIHILQTKLETVQAEIVKPATPDMLEDPKRYFDRTRGEAFRKYESAFSALLVVIPATMAVVGILCVIAAFRRGVPWQTERGLNADQRARAEKLRISLKDKFKR